MFCDMVQLQTIHNHGCVCKKIECKIVAMHKTARVDPSALELAYLAFFVGLRVNELVMQRAAKAGFHDVRERHGFVIQHLIEADRTVTELARSMGVTQQAGSKAVAELLKIGLVETGDAKDRRAKHVRLSERGWTCVRLGRRLRSEIDARLVSAVGKPAYQRTRLTLLKCLEVLGGLESIRGRRIREPQ
jgi:DNA-binding MarR family transcriptional regulator